MTRKEACYWLEQDAMLAASNGIYYATWVRDDTVTAVSYVANINSFGLKCVYELAYSQCVGSQD